MKLFYAIEYSDGSYFCFSGLVPVLWSKKRPAEAYRRNHLESKSTRVVPVEIKKIDE